MPKEPPPYFVDFVDDPYGKHKGGHEEDRDSAQCGI
jgi:hypothetical protein